jgi:hypothetical protein
VNCLAREAGEHDEYHIPMFAENERHVLEPYPLEPHTLVHIFAPKELALELGLHNGNR